MATTVTDVPPAGARRRRAARRLVPPLLAGVAVFFINNFLLARLLTSLPGGTPLAVTNMVVLAVVACRLRAFGVVTLMYAAYATLGVLGHLGVDASTYVLHLPRVLGAALAFDVVLLLGRYRRWALLAGVLPFGVVLLVGFGLSLRQWLVAFGLAGLGLLSGMLAEVLLPPRAKPGAGD